MLKITLALTLVLFCNSALANFTLEPWLGFENGELQRGSSDYSAKGLRYGLRLGYKAIDNIVLGVDYGLGSLEIDSNPSEDMDLTEMGFYGSLQVAEARVWFEYIFSSEVEYQLSGNTDGSGTKVGFGYFISPGFSLNLEKANREHDSNSQIVKGDLDTFIFSASYVF